MDMKNKRKNILLIELSLILFLITGCFPSVDNENISESNNLISEVDVTNSLVDFSDDFPTNIKDNEVDNLNIDAEIIMPKELDIESKLCVSTVNYTIWDKDYIVSELFDDKQLVDITQTENSGPDDVVYTYDFDDNSSLTIYRDRIRYNTEMSIRCQYYFYFDYYKNFIFKDTMAKIFGNTDIEGIDKTEAIFRANDVMSILKINDIIGEPEIYSMTAETINRLQKENNVMDKYGNLRDEITSDQEAYLIVYPIIYNDIPSLKLNATGENELLSGSSAYVIFGRDGIIGFDISGIFDISDVVLNKTIYSPLKVEDDIKKYFNDIILDSRLNISMIKLSNIIRKNYKTQNNQTNDHNLIIEPVWFVYGQYDDFISSNNLKDSIEKEYITLISAVSGEKIPVMSVGG